MENLFKKQTVLIVDDSIISITYLSKILGGTYNIKTASNGEGALNILAFENPPDLIILDVIMPGMDGYEVCGKIKSDLRTKDIPIIFITGKGNEEDEIRGFNLGAVDYIAKPFNPVIVKARVSTHMELKKYRDVLESLSYMDGLTCISNRRKFDQEFELMWNIAKREKSLISIIMIDIDQFKAFNDLYGHWEGDACLKKVAQCLSATVSRKTDIVARYGGEEFICVMRNTILNDTCEMAEKMRSNIEALGIPHKGSETAEVITVSLGIGHCVPASDDDSDKLIQAADEALYRAKKEGRNRINFLGVV